MGAQQFVDHHPDQRKDDKGEALLSAVLDKNLKIIAPPFPEAEKKADE